MQSLLESEVSFFIQYPILLIDLLGKDIINLKYTLAAFFATQNYVIIPHQQI